MNSNKQNSSGIPPRVPQRRSHTVLLCTIIAICGVLLSGVVGYAAAGYASRPADNTTTITEDSSGNRVYTTNSSDIVALDVSQVVPKIAPSVVEITTEIVTNGNSIFQQYIAQGAGSGVILSEDGYIVTNNHVIEGASNITVKLMTGEEYTATLIGTDSATDVAILKIDANGLTPAKVGNSDEIQVGEVTIAIGNPLGSLGGTVTTGIISAVGREITISGETMTLLQTDAAINSGNSGGGLFNADGELIGIVNAKTAASGIEGLGFAIPISDVVPVIEDLEANGKVTSRPMINASLTDITAESGTSMTPGVYVVQVVEGGAAANAGLLYGDRIVSVDGQDVSTTAEVKKILREHAIGDIIEMVIERNNQTQTVTLQLNQAMN